MQGTTRKIKRRITLLTTGAIDGEDRIHDITDVYLTRATRLRCGKLVRLEIPLTIRQIA
jgi:hypothetical protein